MRSLKSLKMLCLFEMVPGVLIGEEKGKIGQQIFLVAKLLYDLKCPSVCMSETFWGKRDLLGSYKR